MRLGKILADYRYANRQGVRGLAAEIGISAATLHRIEHDNDCDSVSLIKILTWMFSDGGVRRPKERR